MRKARVTVTIDEVLIKKLDRLAVKQRKNRSRLVEEALEFWEKEQLRQELVKGYQEMAGEDAKTAESNLGTGYEALS